MRRACGDLATSVKVEELSRHLLNCGARSVALLRPALPAERMEPGRGRVTRDVGCGSIPLDLVDAIKRDIQPIAALVLDHRRFDGAFPEEHFLNSAIDPNSVLEMDDVITRRERRQTLDAG